MFPAVAGNGREGREPKEEGGVLGMGEGMAPGGASAALTGRGEGKGRGNAFGARKQAVRPIGGLQISPSPEPSQPRAGESADPSQGRGA